MRGNAQDGFLRNDSGIRLARDFIGAIAGGNKEC